MNGRGRQLLPAVLQESAVMIISAAVLDIDLSSGMRKRRAAGLRLLWRIAGSPVYVKKQTVVW